MRVSASKIKAFKSCRRMYELKYVEGLVPVEKPLALEMGSNYHKLVEFLNDGGNIAGNLVFGGDYSKELAMARAYESYIYPKVHVSEAEKWFEKETANGDKVVGIVDGITKDGYIVEHKTTGSAITEQYEYNLQWDEQILMYMWLTGCRKVWYTVCMKPSIRQKQNETEEQFFYRMLDWYESDTDSKIRLLEIERTDEEVEQFENDLMQIIEEMKNTGLYYKNTCHCNMWGRRCEYSSVCMYYDPNQEYIEFEKKEAEE